MLTDNEPFPFLPGQYDLIVVPGTKLQVPYVPADHNCGDSHGLLAGNFRVLGAVAWHMIELRQLSAFGIDGGPQLTPILFTGGQTKPVNAELDEATPTEAEVFKTAFQKTFQLVCAIDPEVKAASQQHGRPVLLTETVSDTTATGAAAALEIAREAGMRRVEFITNMYHEPRSKIRVDSIASEAGSNVATTHSVAEDYAEHVFGQPFRNMSLKAYGSEVGCRRLRYEALGMAALFDGQYNMPGYRPEVVMDKSKLV